MVTENSSNI